MKHNNRTNHKEIINQINYGMSQCTLLNLLMNTRGTCLRFAVTYFVQ